MLFNGNFCKISSIRIFSNRIGCSTTCVYSVMWMIHIMMHDICLFTHISMLVFFIASVKWSQKKGQGYGRELGGSKRVNRQHLGYMT